MTDGKTLANLLVGTWTDASRAADSVELAGLSAGAATASHFSRAGEEPAFRRSTAKDFDQYLEERPTRRAYI